MDIIIRTIEELKAFMRYTIRDLNVSERVYMEFHYINEPSYFKGDSKQDFNQIMNEISYGRCPKNLTLIIRFSAKSDWSVCNEKVVANAMISGKCPQGFNCVIRQEGNRPYWSETEHGYFGTMFTKALLSGRCKPGLSLDISGYLMFSDTLFDLLKALSSGKCPEKLSLNLNNIRISSPVFQQSLAKLIADALEKGKIPFGFSLELCNTLKNHNAAVLIQNAVLSLNFINTLRIKKIITGHWDVDIKIARKIQYVVAEIQGKIPLSLRPYEAVNDSPLPKFSSSQSTACFCAVERDEAKFRAYQSENIFSKREQMKTRFEQQKVNIKKAELFLDAQRTYTAMANESETESSALLRTFYAGRKDIRFRDLHQNLDRANADAECGNCMNEYGLPVHPKCILMPCRHTICNVCVASLHDTPNAQSSCAGMQRNEYGDLYYSIFDCPICKRGVASIERI